MIDFRDERDQDYQAFRSANTGLFVRDPHAAVVAIARDGANTNSQRVLAWVKRASWGNYRLFCVREDGKPALQTDCAKELALNKGTISGTLKDLAERGYIRVEGKLLYPALDPSAPRPLPEKVDPRLNFSTFEKSCWKVDHASTFEREQVVQAEAKSIALLKQAAFKKWRRDQRKALASLLKDLGPDSKTDEQGGSSVSPPPTHHDGLRAWLTARFDLSMPLDGAVLDEIASHLHNEGAFERFYEQIETQKPRPRSWKYFVSIAQAAGKAAAASDVLWSALEAERIAWQKRLASNDYVLAADVVDRKPAESERIDEPERRKAMP